MTSSEAGSEGGQTVDDGWDDDSIDAGWGDDDDGSDGADASNEDSPSEDAVDDGWDDDDDDAVDSAWDDPPSAAPSAGEASASDGPEWRPYRKPRRRKRAGAKEAAPRDDVRVVGARPASKGVKQVRKAERRRDTSRGPSKRTERRRQRQQAEREERLRQAAQAAEPKKRSKKKKKKAVAKSQPAIKRPQAEPRKKRRIQTKTGAQAKGASPTESAKPRRSKKEASVSPVAVSAEEVSRGRSIAIVVAALLAVGLLVTWLTTR